MRSFVAVWPPDDVVSVLAVLDRPPLPSVRWTTPDQWHVTLRFLGEADPDEVAAAVGPAVAGLGPRTVALGPATRRLGSSILMVPVGGLDDLAAALPWPEERPFTGHLTLARARRRSAVPAVLAGVTVSASWRCTSVSLVRSTLSPRGAVYDDVAAFPL